MGKYLHEKLLERWWWRMLKIAFCRQYVYYNFVKPLQDVNRRNDWWILSGVRVGVEAAAETLTVVYL